jgi:hypothetical protein
MKWIYVNEDKADIVLATLGLTRSDVGRFRGVYIVGNEITIITRNGAGNREHYGDTPAGPDCLCPGCFMAYRVNKLPYYLYDEDDDDDPTYAYIYFEIPPEHAELIGAIASDSFEPSEPWLGMLERLKEGSRPEVAERLRPVIEILRGEEEVGE